MVPIVASVGGSLLALVTAAAIFMRVKNKKKQGKIVNIIEHVFSER